jgi:hypothetical protein
MPPEGGAVSRDEHGFPVHRFQYSRNVAVWHHRMRDVSTVCENPEKHSSSGNMAA